MACHDADFVLIPEVDFDLHGETGFLTALRQRVRERGCAVVVVAEGAGQRLLTTSGGADASGNTALADIGLFLKAAIISDFDAV